MPSTTTLSRARPGKAVGTDVKRALITVNWAVAQINCPPAKATGDRPDWERNRRENGKPKPYEQAATRHMASPASVLAVSAGVAPRRTSAPTKPTPRPATRRRPGRSEGISHTVAGSTRN